MTEEDDSPDSKANEKTKGQVSKPSDTTNQNETDKVLLEFLRFSHGLVAKKFNTMVVVNGLLFSAFNLLTIRGENSLYFTERIIITVVGGVFSYLWAFNIGRSLIYTKSFKEKINNTNLLEIEGNLPKSIEFWGKRPSGKIVLLGAVAQIILWGVLFSYVILSKFLHSMLPIVLKISKTELNLPNEIITLIIPFIGGVVIFGLLWRRKLI